jgi:hypothetical protein
VEVTKAYLGNLVAVLSMSYNSTFMIIMGDNLHILGAVLTIVFTALLNTRRAIREVFQLYLIFRAKNNADINRLLQEDLEKDDKV